MLFTETAEDDSSISLGPIIIALIVVVGVVAVAVTVVIGIVCYKTRKEQRGSARLEFELPEMPSDSKQTSSPKTSGHYEVKRESRKYVDVEPSLQLASMKVEKNVAYGIGKAQAYGVEGGKYAVIQPQAPSEIPSKSAVPRRMAVNVAYEETGHWV